MDDEKVERHRQQIVVLTEQNIDLQNQIEEQADGMLKLQSFVETLNTQHQELTQKFQALMAETSTLSSERSQLTSDLELQRENNERQMKEFAAARVKMQRAPKSDESPEKMDRHRVQIVQLTEQNIDLQSQIDEQSEGMGKLQDFISNLNQKNTEMSANLRLLEDRVNSLTAEGTRASGERVAYEKQVADLSAQLRAAQEATAAAKATIASTATTLPSAAPVSTASDVIVVHRLNAEIKELTDQNKLHQAHIETLSRDIAKLRANERAAAARNMQQLGPAPTEHDLEELINGFRASVLAALPEPPPHPSSRVIRTPGKTPKGSDDSFSSRSLPDIGAVTGKAQHLQVAGESLFNINLSTSLDKILNSIGAVDVKSLGDDPQFFTTILKRTREAHATKLLKIYNDELDRLQAN